jgi:hypothetical protein
MHAAVVFLSDEDDMKDKIAKFKETAGVKNVSLALDSSKGPERYNIEKKADVTAVFYKSRKVLANHAFESFTEKDVEAVASDLSKLK